MKKKIAILLSCMVCIVAFQTGIKMNAQDSTTANIIIQETLLQNGLYQVELSVANAADLYGISLDMQFDSTKLEIVDDKGAPILDPVMSPADFFGPNITDKQLEVLTDVYGVANNGDAYVAVNSLADNKISFVKFLAGNRIGVNIPAKSTFGFIYFKVKEGQQFDGFGNLTVTSDLKQMSNSQLCVKLSDSDGDKITPLIISMPQDIAANVEDVDLTYFAGQAFAVTFNNTALDAFDATQIELVLMKEDQTNVVIPNAVVTKNATTKVFTIAHGALPTTMTSKGVFGLKLKLWDNNYLYAKLKENSQAIQFYPAYSNSNVTITPQLKDIANLKATSTPITMTFGTVGSLSFASGLDILAELDQFYHLQDFVNFHVNSGNDGVYSLQVDLAQLSSLSGKMATVTMNQVPFSSVKVSNSSVSGLNPLLNTSTHSLSFQTDDFSKTWVVTQGKATLALTLNAVDFVGKGVALSNMPAQLMIKRGNTVINTIDFTANAGNAQFDANILLNTDYMVGDLLTVKLAGYATGTSTIQNLLVPDSVVNVAIDVHTGNLNTDNVIDALDAALFAAEYGKTGNGLLADLNKDASVDILDLYYISKNIE